MGRRAPDIAHPKFVFHQTSFLDGVLDWFEVRPIDDVFIALGTTIKAAGSRAAFRALDLDAVVAIARTALAQGASRLAVVSAMGADPRSSVFYSRIKGEMEAAVGKLGFETLMIARPSLLAGDRESLNQNQRPAEKMALIATRWLNPLLPANYRSVQAGQVANAMVDTLRAGGATRTVLLSGEIRKFPENSQI